MPFWPKRAKRPVKSCSRIARAKINLALHVTGRRADGYHLLDSLVVFADLGDRITVTEAADLSLRITGPFGAGLPVDGRNLVMRAAQTMSGGRGAAITLDKHLPPASGIGGGSADAAATLHALADLWGLPLPDAEAVLRLGADVPACLAGHSLRMTGIGETLHPAPGLPPLPAVLVNPGVEVPTPAVFSALACRENPPLPDLPALPDAAAAARWLAAQRNDLEHPAQCRAPAITPALAAIAAVPGCLLARMSGSGATCFGLFATPDAAQGAAQALARPGWWVRATTLGQAPCGGA